MSVSEKTRDWWQTLKDQGAEQAYRNCADWLRRLPYDEVQQRISDKVTEITTRKLAREKGGA